MELNIKFHEWVKSWQLEEIRLGFIDLLVLLVRSHVHAG